MRSKSQIEEKLAVTLSDERLHYPTATVQINAPLALIQCSLETQRDTLRWVLQGDNDFLESVTKKGLADALEKIVKLGTEWSANYLGNNMLQMKRWKRMMEIAQKALDSFGAKPAS